MTLALFAQAVLTIVRTRLATGRAGGAEPAQGGASEPAASFPPVPACSTGSLAAFRQQRQEQEQEGRWTRHRRTSARDQVRDQTPATT